MKADYPAFPADEFLGIDIRTYLAAKAMQGILAHPDLTYVHEGKHTKSMKPEVIAILSVEFADALIVELNKEQK